jgi:hypothetical protein
MTMGWDKVAMLWAGTAMVWAAAARLMRKRQAKERAITREAERMEELYSQRRGLRYWVN